MFSPCLVCSLDLVEYVVGFSSLPEKTRLPSQPKEGDATRKCLITFFTILFHDVTVESH